MASAPASPTQSLFDHPAIVSYFSKFWAEGRKFNLVCTGITQNSVYMLAHEEARNMVLNSDFILLHKQSPLDRKAWVELVAGAARVPIKDDFPKGELYDLFNTKPDEVAEARRAAGDTGRLARRVPDLMAPPGRHFA